MMAIYHMKIIQDCKPAILNGWFKLRILAPVAKSWTLLELAALTLECSSALVNICVYDRVVYFPKSFGNISKQSRIVDWLSMMRL